MYIDGASKGNPGLSGVGVIICNGEEVIKNIAKCIGEATNNFAEYMALIYGLQEALILRADEVEVKTDSQLLFRQITKQYKVKNANIKPLYEQAAHLISGFSRFDIDFISRSENKGADKLATKAIRKEQAKMVGPTHCRAGKSGLQRAA